MSGPQPGTVQTVPPNTRTRIVGTILDVLHDGGGNVNVAVRGDGSVVLPAGVNWTVYAETSAPALNRLQQAARNLADHTRAWEVFRTVAVLEAWVQARERGIGSVDSDTLAHAAVNAIHDRIRHWAAEEPDVEEAGDANDHSG